MAILAIIQARGGSKGLPGKNVKLLSGKPLIAYSIEAALAAKKVDRVIISTDDAAIAEVASRFGAQVPFMRPSALAQDTTPDFPVYQHALSELKKKGETFEVVVMLRPTTPFKTPAMIDAAVERLEKDPSLSSVRSVTRAQGVFHPFWMFKGDQGVLTPFIDGIDPKKWYQRQTLPECWRLNGVVDVVRSENILEKQDLYGARIGYFEVSDEHSIDIDNEFDFKLCEYLMERSK